MEKIIKSILLIAIGSWISFNVIAAPHVQPVRAMEIPYTNGVTIDGVADDCYSLPQSTIAYNNEGSTGADEDFTLSFRVCYDTLRLYLYANILDDYISSIPYTTSPEPWMYDNVEVFISLDTTGTIEGYDTNTTMLRFNRGIQDSAQMPGRADQSEYAGNVYYENIDSGWVLEVGIPWTAVLGSGQMPEDIMDYIKAGTVNGFDVHGSDNDTDGHDQKDCQTAWDSDGPEIPDATEDLAWCNRIYFGIMTLLYEENNEVPVANAGPDQLVNENTMVTLDGAGSYDPESGPISYVWSAPLPISLSDIHSDSPNFTAPEVDQDTDYSISLVVNDGVLNSEEDTVIIHVLQVEPPESAKSEEISGISIYPNPAHQFLSVNSGILIYSIEILDLNGEIIYTKYINRLDVEMNFESLAKGIYLMRLNTEAGPVMKRFTII